MNNKEAPKALLPHPDSPESLRIIVQHNPTNPISSNNDRKPALKNIENKMGGPMEPILRKLVDVYKMSSRQMSTLVVNPNGETVSYGLILRALIECDIEPIPREYYRKTGRAKKLSEKRSIATRNKKMARVAENLGVDEDSAREKLIDLLKHGLTIEQVCQSLKTRKEVISEITGLKRNGLRMLRTQGILERAVQHDVLRVLSKREINTLVSCTKMTETEFARDLGLPYHQSVSRGLIRAKRKLEEAIKQKTHLS